MREYRDVGTCEEAERFPGISFLLIRDSCKQMPMIGHFVYRLPLNPLLSIMHTAARAHPVDPLYEEKARLIQS